MNSLTDKQTDRQRQTYTGKKYTDKDTDQHTDKHRHTHIFLVNVELQQTNLFNKTFYINIYSYKSIQTSNRNNTTTNDDDDNDKKDNNIHPLTMIVVLGRRSHYRKGYHNAADDMNSISSPARRTQHRNNHSAQESVPGMNVFWWALPPRQE